MAKLPDLKGGADSEKIRPIETRKPGSVSESRRRKFARFLGKSVVAGLCALPAVMVLNRVNELIEPKTEKKMEIRYETPRGLPVKKGDDIQLHSDGPAGIPVRAKITDVDDKGITLSFDDEVFMAKMATRAIRLEYGKSQTFDAGSQITVITAEKGERTGEAKLAVTYGAEMR